MRHQLGSCRLTSPNRSFAVRGFFKRKNSSLTSLPSHPIRTTQFCCRLSDCKNFATTSTDVPPKGCSYTIPSRRVYFRRTRFLLSAPKSLFMLSNFSFHSQSPAQRRFYVRLFMFPILTNTPKQIKKPDSSCRCVRGGFNAFLEGFWRRDGMERR